MVLHHRVSGPEERRPKLRRKIGCAPTASRRLVAVAGPGPAILLKIAYPTSSAMEISGQIADWRFGGLAGYDLCEPFSQQQAMYDRPVPDPRGNPHLVEDLGDMSEQRQTSLTGYKAAVLARR